jgi:hypothetical protein
MWLQIICVVVTPRAMCFKNIVSYMKIAKIELPGELIISSEN